ncbi:MAG: phage tail sheath subtilisin-like domain-containing protein [Gammaproteobacteria bacterium]|nr:phage tail sheath subtilisin-like domain-containing protein [Gammaproteobacteria bacterium]
MDFNEIPIDLRVPGSYVEVDSSRALKGSPAMPHRALIIGQRLAAGTVAANTPTRTVSAAEGETQAGRGSMLAAMIAAFKKANPYTPTTMVALDDDGAGVAHTKTITITGPATAAGSINLYVGGQRVKTAVASTDTGTAIATAVAAAVNADTSLLFTAASALGVVTLTARNKGAAGNDVDVRLNYYDGETLPAGVGAVIADGVAGANNPDITAALAAIGDTQYHTIVMPYTDAANLTVLETELSSRWGPMKMIEGHAFAAAGGTHSDITTLGDSRNSPHVTILGGQDSPTPPYVLAAVVAAVDATATEADPNRPRQSLALPGVMAPAEADRYTYPEQDLHLRDGISTFVVDDGGVCRIQRLITTSQTKAGVPDTSYLNVTDMRNIMYLRYSLRATVALKFPRFKLADDGARIAPGQAITTPTRIKEVIVALARSDWEKKGLVENIDQFKKDLVIERDGANPDRVNALIPPDLVNGFRIFAAQIQFIK